jgi:hypothetical protein
MYYTKEQQLEKVLLVFTNQVMEATLKVADDLRKEGQEEKAKAFATGTVCMMDAIQLKLLPQLRELVKENPRYFENNN